MDMYLSVFVIDTEHNIPTVTESNANYAHTSKWHNI